MTKPSSNAKIVKKIVVFFDICSSTSILEDLIRTENQLKWRNLLINLKKFLCSKQSDLNFEIYKFLGDGWVLMLEPQSEGLDILFFLDELSKRFLECYNQKIKDVLTTRIPNVGLTFGMDIGSCIRFVMNDRKEYTGRPLNVAARLQGAIGQRDESPQYKVLLSNNLYATFEDQKRIKRKYKIGRAKRTLKNISGGDEYLCRKIWLGMAR